MTLIGLVGCSSGDKPKDLPPLYPCTLTIIQDGASLAEATVEFVPAVPSKYRPASLTGEDGTVSMRTYGFPGVPAGKYKVVVSKEIRENLVYTDTINPSTGQKEVVSFTRYQTVEPQYSSADSSPHEIEITGKEKVRQTFDVGKAVRTEVQSSQ